MLLKFESSDRNSLLGIYMALRIIVKSRRLSFTLILRAISVLSQYDWFSSKRIKPISRDIDFAYACQHSTKTN